MLLVNNHKCKNATTSYPTDLTNSQWQVIEGYVKDKRKRRYSSGLFSMPFFSGEDRLPVADVAGRLSRMANGLLLFQPVEKSWNAGANTAGFGGKAAQKSRKRITAPAAIIGAHSVKTTLAGGESIHSDDT